MPENRRGLSIHGASRMSFRGALAEGDDVLRAVAALHHHCAVTLMREHRATPLRLFR